MILAGDIGGTSARLALFEPGKGLKRPAALEIYPSRRSKSFDELVGTFLAAHPAKIRRASFGVAGPVTGGRCAATNLPWVVDGRRLAGTLGLKSVGLLNDLEAGALGIAALGPKDMIVLNKGKADPRGNAALISAGTGLGEAGLIWKDGRRLPVASEGGHADFAPADALEDRLLLYLRKRHGHVSYERVLSGPGLYDIYKFLLHAGRTRRGRLARRLMQDDPAAAVSRAALDGTSALCARALELFVAVYGRAAGNLALKFKATGGLYIGGGIAPKILAKLQGPIFLENFLSKGRMKPLLQSVPVRVILNDKTALWGAALSARG